jgi:hypothetical protein
MKDFVFHSSGQNVDANRERATRTTVVRQSMLNAIRGGVATLPLIGEWVRPTKVPRLDSLALNVAYNFIGIAIAFVILLVVFGSFSVALNILQNFIGCKVTGYEFHGGVNVLGYLYVGLYMSLPATAFAIFFGVLSENAISVYRVLNYFTPIAWAALGGATGALMNEAKGLDTITPSHAAIAGAASGCCCFVVLVVITILIWSWACIASCARGR